MIPNSENLNGVRLGVARFLNSCQANDLQYCLTPRAETSPFALCFGLFIQQLLGNSQAIEMKQEPLRQQLMANLRAYHALRSQQGRTLIVDKPFLQLLCFTLSSLSLVDGLRNSEVERWVLPFLPADLPSYLQKVGALEGRPGSGNLAMFVAILLLHAEEYLGLKTHDQVQTWVDLHLRSINRFGFWGNARSMSYLQFQNGYHQYEIFSYLGITDAPWKLAAQNTARLIDFEGHFAPYPGGGGCFDYDAIFFLTSAGPGYERELELTRRSLLQEQNNDGGFAESLSIRPRNFLKFYRQLGQIRKVPPSAKVELIRYLITLQRPKHDRIHTHWSRYSRHWGESDLWDTWFRLLSLVRIACYCKYSSKESWGFLSYPGIGFYESK